MTTITFDARMFFSRVGIITPTEWEINEYKRCIEFYQKEARNAALEEAAQVAIDKGIRNGDLLTCSAIADLIRALKK